MQSGFVVKNVFEGNERFEVSIWQTRIGSVANGVLSGISMCRNPAE